MNIKTFTEKLEQAVVDQTIARTLRRAPLTADFGAILKARKKSRCNHRRR